MGSADLVCIRRSMEAAAAAAKRRTRCELLITNAGVLLIKTSAALLVQLPMSSYVVVSMAGTLCYLSNGVGSD